MATDPNQNAEEAALDAGLNAQSPITKQGLSATVKAAFVAAGVFGASGVGGIALLQQQVANIGAANTDASRLTAGILSTARLPNAGGDASGPYGSLTVAKIKGLTPAAVATSGAYGDLSGRPAAGTDYLAPNGNGSALMVQPTGGLTLRSDADKHGERLTVLDFGAKCDGVLNTSTNTWSGTDDTAALNKAYTSGKNVDVPGRGIFGACLFSSTLQINMPNLTLSGRGTYEGRLVYTATTANPSPSTTSDLIQVSQNATPQANGAPGYGRTTISNLAINSAVKMTAGAAIHQFNQGFVDYRNVSVGAVNPANLYHGWWFDEIDLTTVIGFFASAAQDAVRVSGGGTGNAPQYDLFMTHGKITGSAVGVHIGGGFDNAFFNDVMDTSNGQNVVIDNVIASYPNQDIIFGSTFAAEYGTTDNYYINDTLCTASITICSLTIAGHSILAGAGSGGSPNASGIHIKAFSGGHLSVQAPYISGNAGSGILSEDSSAVMSVDAATQIRLNAYGIRATTAWAPLSIGQVIDNTSANLSNVTSALVQPGPITVSPTTYSGTPGVVNKLALFGAIGNNPYGFGVSAGSIDTIAPAGGGFNWWLAGTNLFSIQPGGATLNTSLKANSLQENLSTPASSAAACSAGQISVDANFVYVCTASNAWKRSALSAF